MITAKLTQIAPAQTVCIHQSFDPSTKTFGFNMLQVTQIVDHLTVDHAKEYAQTTDKLLFVADNFFDVTSIDDLPWQLVERIEEKLEQLLNRSKEYKVEQWYNEDAKKDGWALMEFRVGSFNEDCIDIYPTKAQALKVLKQLTATNS